MFLDPGKCNYLIINKDIHNESIELGYKILDAETKEKLLAILTDKVLNFQSQKMFAIKKSNQTLSAFVKVKPYMAALNKNAIFNSLLKTNTLYLRLVL